MQRDRDEASSADGPDFGAKAPVGFSILLFGGLHLLCCGLPLLLLSGVSLATIFPSWPVIGGIIAVIGVVGFIWYLRKGCATCPGNPKNCRARHARDFVETEGKRDARSG